MQRVVFTREGPYMGESVGPLTTSMATFVGNGHHQQGDGDQKKQGHGFKGLFRKIKDEL
jgi:hypothetical protein